jgi:hypothetical protein
MGWCHGQVRLRGIAGAMGCVLLVFAGSAQAATPTQTVLTGGMIRYQGSATADLHTSDSFETVDDHAQGTFDESWLVSPYQVAATYRNA